MEPTRFYAVEQKQNGKFSESFPESEFTFGKRNAIFIMYHKRNLRKVRYIDMKRFLSLVLTLAMVLSLMAGICIGVSAEEYTMIGEASLTGTEIPELAVSGLVHVSLLSRKFVRFNESDMSLSAPGGGSWRVGDRIKVNVAKVDFRQRRIDFVPCRRGKRF
jgi:hypothetical protein